MCYVLSTSWHANTKLHRGECARELLLEVAHDGRADKIVEDGPYGNGPYATIFLGYGNQPSTKKYGLRCSRMNWWLAAILLLHSLQMALTASEFICLMVSDLNPNTPTTLSIFAFLGQIT